jgi:hypothetical protein
MIDFLVDINSNVIQFKISLNEKKSIIVIGNKINNEAFELIKKASDKDYFIISEIKTNYMSDDQCFPRYPMSIAFQLKD